MMDHASLFTEIVHSYLPKLYILIYRNCTLLFTNYSTLLFTDYNLLWSPINWVYSAQYLENMLSINFL